MLYSIFLLGLQNAQNRVNVLRKTPQRVEEIFIGFIRCYPVTLPSTTTSPSTPTASTSVPSISPASSV